MSLPPYTSIPFWDTNPNILSLLSADESNLGITIGGFQYAPTEWDIVRYGAQGMPIPGLAIIRHCSRKLKLDKKSPAGTDGVDSTFQGVLPLHFHFDLLFWTPEQLNDLANTVMPVVFPGKGRPVFQTTYAQTGAAGFSGGSAGAGFTGAAPVIQAQKKEVGQVRVPVLLRHPALQFHGVRSVIVEEVLGPQRWRGHNDIYELLIKCVEFKPTKPSQTVTPSSATLTTSVGAANQPSLNSAQTTDPASNGSGAAP